MKDIVFHIPRGLRGYTIVQQAIIGRMVVLSQKGAKTVYYSTEDAKRDGFKRAFTDSVRQLKEVLEIRKGFRGCRQINVLQVLEMDSCIYINVPVSIMQRDDLNFAEKIVFGRIYTQTKQGTEKIKLTTSMIVNELGLADRTVKTYLKHLADLKLITAQNEFNGFANERFVSVNVDELEAHVSAESAPTILRNLHQQNYEICTNSFTDSALSSSMLQEHILQEPLLQECKKQKQEVITKDNSYPLSSTECEIYFSDYIQKYAHTNPALQMVNVPFEASQFFEYWSGRDWKDNKGKKVKSLKGRVATWIGRNIEKYERQLKRSNPMARLKSFEQLCDENGHLPNPFGFREDAKVLGFNDKDDEDEQPLNDELPF